MSDFECVVCGREVAPEDIRENGAPVCETCVEVKMAEALLDKAEDRGLEALREGFLEADFWYDDTIARLCDDAERAAKRDDLDEAIMLLRQAARPKFHSIEDCKKRYAEVIAEKREREAA